jgi:hypothetical protein
MTDISLAECLRTDARQTYRREIEFVLPKRQNNGQFFGFTPSLQNVSVKVPPLSKVHALLVSSHYVALV